MTTTTTGQALRHVMGKFPTGVTVITTPGPNIHGMTANAFTSVSLDPPLVLGCVAKSAHMHDLICRARRFAVTILAAEQCEVALYFASRHRPEGIAQFREWDWSPGPCTGAPLIAGAAGWLECDVIDLVPAGDHTIVVGQVLDCAQGDADGLAFYCGQLSPLGQATSVDLTERHVA